MSYSFVFFICYLSLRYYTSKTFVTMTARWWVLRFLTNFVLRVLLYLYRYLMNQTWVFCSTQVYNIGQGAGILHYISINAI